MIMQQQQQMSTTTTSKKNAFRLTTWQRHKHSRRPLWIDFAMSVHKGDTTNLRSRKPKTMVPYHSSNHVSQDDNLSADIAKLLDTTNEGVKHELTTYPPSVPDSVVGVRYNDCDEGGGPQMNHIDILPETRLISDNEQIVGETTFIEGNDLEPLISQEDSDTIELKLEESTETSLSICLQVTLPYLIAGLGMVLAGLVLDTVQHWPVFTEVSEIFVLVPSLLGLKGNLEMTLASRLSTQANIGNMDKSSEKWKMIGGNMALIQAQAIVVGFLASVVAMVMGWIPDGVFNVEHGLLLCASSMCTAAVASFILGSIMVGVVLISNKCNINPDNVATPIAASLGDLTTLALLSGVACLLYKAIGNQHWLAPVMIAFFILLTPLWIYVSIHNHYTHDVVYSGWVPVLSAMVISSIGGLILDFAVTYYSGIAVFQPVINGVGGNLVAVQASRISTSLHQVCKPGKLPNTSPKGCPNCPSAFFGKSLHAKAARVLVALVIPGHLIFMYTISFMKAGHTSITFVFSLMYLTAAVLQVVVLLYIANWMVHFIWRKGDDPDNVAIPYLTAIGDLLGTAFLAIAFHVLFLIGDRDADGSLKEGLCWNGLNFNKPGNEIKEQTASSNPSAFPTGK